MKKFFLRLIVLGTLFALVVPTYTIYANDKAEREPTTLEIDVEDATVIKDDTSFDLLKDVLAIDADGKEYEVTILDNGDFDITTIGKYTVVYSVVDPTTKEIITQDRVIDVIEEVMPMVAQVSSIVNNATELNAALASATEGDVITLSDTFVLGAMYVTMPGVNVTIDGNGVTRTSGTFAISGANTGSITFTNLNIDASTIGNKVFDLRNTGGQVIFDNVEIRNATATAIYMATSGTALTTIKNTMIVDSLGAPAVYLESYSNVNIEYSTFENNEGNKGGWESATISSKQYRGILNIDNTVFRNNRNSAANTGIYGGGGGAIEIHYFMGGSINIDECYFVGNEAGGTNTAAANTQDGGAIYVFDGQAGATFNISNTTFDSNLSHDDGGAIMFQAAGSPGLTTNISNSTFYNNTAQGLNGGFRSGGAIQYFKNGNSAITKNTITGSTFVGNTSGSELTKVSQTGGAIGLSGSGFLLATLSQTNTMYIGNQVYGTNGQINTASNNKDLSNTSSTTLGTDIIGADRGGATINYTTADVLGIYSYGLSPNFSTIKAGKEQLIVPTLPIKPEGLAENTSTTEVTGNDERTFDRFKDIGAIESTFIKYDANGGEFGLTALTTYDGTKYYEPNDEDTFTTYYDVGYIGLSGTIKSDTTLSATNGTMTFLGWSTNPAATAGDPTYAPGSAVTHVQENLTLYAIWANNSYIITYDYDGGVAPTTANPSSYDAEDTFPIAISNEPTRDGYTFTGWTVDYENTDLTDITTATKNYSVPDGTTGDIALTATWTINNYVLTFDLNDSTLPLPSAIGKPEDQILDFGMLATKPVNPTKEGYTFDGWYEDEACTNPWDFTTETMPAANKTLYAKWVAIIPIVPDDEEIPVVPETPKTPTGDTTNIASTVGLVSISGLLLILIAIRKRFTSK